MSLSSSICLVRIKSAEPSCLIMCPSNFSFLFLIRGIGTERRVNSKYLRLPPYKKKIFMTFFHLTNSVHSSELFHIWTQEQKFTKQLHQKWIKTSTSVPDSRSKFNTYTDTKPSDVCPSPSDLVQQGQILIHIKENLTDVEETEKAHTLTLALLDTCDHTKERSIAVNHPRS